ncbi:MAG: polysaccharide deacetylase family protein [Erysipelotrichaceae bacterium]|nr:polysaccharide deacetylase family protein [Erysipelotrichaceae bacterium]
MKKKRIMIACLVIGFIVGSLWMVYRLQENNKQQEQLSAQQKVEEIQEHYGSLVQTQRVTLMYQLQEDTYQLAGTLGKGEVISLADEEITAETEYFYADQLGYYVRYQDVMPVNEMITYDQRFQNYIPFDESIVLKEKTTLYDETGQLVLSMPEAMTFPIVIKEDDMYGVNYKDRLVWVRRQDVDQVVEVKNSQAKKATAIRTFCYHKVYDPKEETCNKIICHAMSQMEKHFKYLKEEGYFTMTMQEMLWYIKGKVNLPYKSVCLTFDDGGLNTKNVIKVLEKYDLHATLFLIAKKKADYMISDHLELHSHTYDMHTYGHCNISPRGSAVLCKNSDVVLKDLIKSREVLDGAIAFCYPYYEYNDQLIQLVKEAGFQMAFEGDTGLVRVHDDPYKISRYTFSNNSSVNELAYWLHHE